MAMRLGFAQGSDERLITPNLRRHPRTPLSRLHALAAPLPTALVGRRAGGFIVRDNNGQALAYVYFENEPGRRAAAKLLTRDEARRIAANIAQAARAEHPPLSGLREFPSWVY
jgi:hypothetical protein